MHNIMMIVKKLEISFFHQIFTILSHYFYTLFLHLTLDHSSNHTIQTMTTQLKLQIGTVDPRAYVTYEACASTLFCDAAMCTKKEK